MGNATAKSVKRGRGKERHCNVLTLHAEESAFCALSICPPVSGQMFPFQSSDDA